MSSLDVHARIARLERRVRHLTIISAVLSTGAMILVAAAWSSGSQSEILRARQLVLEDEQGRARVVLGAPLPRFREGGRALPPRIGIAINDSLGFERFGLALRANGIMGMGFDAPLGTGDDRNRERITIRADQNGGSHIRFLNRQTSVVGYLWLDDDDRMWLEFVDVRPDKVVRRRIGFEGEETVEQAR